MHPCKTCVWGTVINPTKILCFFPRCVRDPRRDRKAIPEAAACGIVPEIDACGATPVITATQGAVQNPAHSGREDERLQLAVQRGAGDVAGSPENRKPDTVGTRVADQGNAVRQKSPDEKFGKKASSGKKPPPGRKQGSQKINV